MDLLIDGLVITGGEAPGMPYLAQAARSAEVTVAADAGLDWARRHGIAVDYVVGDMDSLDDGTALNDIPRDHVFTYDVDKDFTDTELAIDLLRRKGCERIGIAGGGGGRLDHLLGVLYLFSRAEPPKVWMTADTVAACVNPRVEVTGMIGNRISFFPVGCEVCHMISAGLEWPLDSLSWSPGDVGISNRITADPMRVTVQSGRLLMVAPLDLMKGLRV